MTAQLGVRLTAWRRRHRAPPVASVRPANGMGRQAEAMAACAARYAESVTQAELAAGGSAPETLARAAAVVQARIDLYNCLTNLGWTAPLGMPREIDLDIRLLREPTGAVGG